MSQYLPGDVIINLPFVGEKLPAVRKPSHRCASVWVFELGPEEHYLLQCDRTLDQHRVLGLFASADVAQLSRGSVQALVDMTRQSDENGEAARRLARSAGVRSAPKVHE